MRAEGNSVRHLSSFASRLDGEGALEVFSRAQELERAGRSIIHLELGEPDFRSPDAVRTSATQALDAGRERYCAPRGVPELQEMLAAYLATTRNLITSPENIIITPGSKTALFLSMMVLVEAGDEVLYPEPGFPIYPSLTRALKGVPVPYSIAESNGFQPDPEELAEKITKRTKLLITNSPHNPTGSVYQHAVQAVLSDLCVAHDLYVVSDEIYARILYSGTYTSLASYPGMADRTLVLDGFSKCFAMTGWRLGYVVAPIHVVPSLEMMIVNSYTCVTEFIQYAALTALRDQEGFTQRFVKELSRRRESFVLGLNEIPGFRCVQPAGAFYAWVNVADTGRPASQLCEMMLQQGGVASLPGQAFGNSSDEFVRFSFAAASERWLYEAIERISNLSKLWRGAMRSLRARQV